MKISNTLAVISLSGMLLGAAGSTLAGDVQLQYTDARSGIVTFNDLDLTNPTDAQTLLDRIYTAAKVACSRSGDRGQDLHVGIDRERCIEISVMNTVARIDKRFNINIKDVAATAGEQEDLVSKR